MASSKRPTAVERVVLIGVEVQRVARVAQPPTSNVPTAAESLEELRELAIGAGAIPVQSLLQRRDRIDSAFFMGRGKVEELVAVVAATAADAVIFDGELSPTQQRNLQREVNVPVISRTQLILDIFARHARTREGQLQVELAQLEYLLPRLAGRGQTMSRLGAGIGTRGPGETKLETDRRRIHQRIRHLRDALSRVRDQRAQQRSQRESVPLAMLALVGYTNAGKSTLFNRLTGAEVLTSGRMFATLDPTVRACVLPSGRRVLFSDTVGFLRNLPHGLISAFRATLEEVTRASLLLVVSDCTSPFREDQFRQVQSVLRELDVEGTPQIQVWNKVDLLDGDRSARLQSERLAQPATVEWVSGRDGTGIDALLQSIERLLVVDSGQNLKLRIPVSQGRLIHLLHERCQILDQRQHESSTDFDALIPAVLVGKFQAFVRS